MLIVVVRMLQRLVKWLFVGSVNQVTQTMVWAAVIATPVLRAFTVTMEPARLRRLRVKFVPITLNVSVAPVM